MVGVRPLIHVHLQFRVLKAQSRGLIRHKRRSATPSKAHPPSNLPSTSEGLFCSRSCPPERKGEKCTGWTLQWKRGSCLRLTQSARSKMSRRLVYTYRYHMETNACDVFDPYDQQRAKIGHVVLKAFVHSSSAPLPSIKATVWEQ